MGLKEFIIKSALEARAKALNAIVWYQLGKYRVTVSSYCTAFSYVIGGI